MKRILLRSSKTPFHAPTAEEVLQQKVGGANLGNLVFSDSAYKMLNVPGTEITLTGFQNKNHSAEEINEQYDYLVLPFANAFRPAYQAQLDHWTRIIEKLTIPVMVLSIGAQSSLDYDLEPLRPLDESVRRFAAAVLDRAPSIGVRGELTQRYLNHLGFKDNAAKFVCSCWSRRCGLAPDAGSVTCGVCIPTTTTPTTLSRAVSPTTSTWPFSPPATPAT